MLVGGALGHMSSEVNLARSRRLQEDGTEEESVNAKWQCEVDEVKQPAHRGQWKRLKVVFVIWLVGLPMASPDCTERLRLGFALKARKTAAEVLPEEAVKL